MSRHSRWVGVVILGLFAAGCGLSSTSTPSTAFCGALVRGSGCSGQTLSCSEFDRSARVVSPTCDAQLDALETCLSNAKLSCQDGADFVVLAAGSGAASSLTVPLIGSYVLSLRTAECNTAAEAWRDCGTCGQALGYGGTAGGMGDPCRTTSQCATGLTCQGGGCFMSCTRVEECLPRHRTNSNECRTSKGRLVECRSGTCATLCQKAAFEYYDCPPSP